jgi:ssDNA-binding replication factor A large subunit
VQFHYALVDDLLTREEFEQRCEEKIKACGDLVDELTAAMLVVQELGRHHVKCSGLSGKPSLFSFFCKVIAKGEPVQFDRADGEKGLVAYLVVGDETGQARLVLWDEKAYATREIELSDVLEVIGRPARKNSGDITVLALRKATCEIECSAAPMPLRPVPAERADLEVRLLALGETRTYTRRDGAPGQMVEGVVGDAAGTARLVCWTPEILTGIDPGCSLRLTGALVRSASPPREYSIDEKSGAEVTGATIEVPCTPAANVSPDEVCSVSGTIASIQPPRPFTSRDGRSSWVRNLVVSDGSGSVRVVLWGDRALMPLVSGDHVAIYHASAKNGRYGETELAVGRGGALLISVPEPAEVTVRGTVIRTRAGTFIDDGEVCYLLDGTFPHGRVVEVRGKAAGFRLSPEESVSVALDPDEIAGRLEHFAEDCR